MTRVVIAVPPRSYDAVIENGSLARAGACLREVLPEHERLFVITVLPVRHRWGKKLLVSLSAAGFKANVVEMPDGERHKKLSTVELLAEKLTRLGADRSAAVVAFGGGVVGDVAGMVASVYMRGVPLVQIPTTLQAQVDAAIGGKTGVNLRTGKNLVGTFHQPRMVLIDPAVLATLPDREFRAGLYESWKAGVIGRPELFERLEKTSGRALRRDAATLQWVIAESVKLKAEVVSQDEREGGLRRVLNYGHTIGHALEAATGYRHFLHGEAVAWGMIAANHIAVAGGHLAPDVARRINEAVAGAGPLPRVTSPSRGILRLLQTDKKTSAGVLHFVLPKEIGRVEIARDVPDKVVIEAVDELRRMSGKK
jgi:3-dehydroquinate synthase